ncbi:PREDICTED: platelet glycoprotein VI [Propithecus coquereli]|uniref:platelet glycoprotein VI n=1 Tax=Propithecus coquereli TaxID=379532 RepID=UPI00063F94F3|nr:PREDICTED: platelet glycoprotein VI [Propithecus coquereli]
MSPTPSALFCLGVYNKPSLLAQPSPAVSPGGDVTLQCQTPYSFDQFALYKEGDPEPYKNPEMWYRASFPIVTVTAAHSGTYRCYSFSSSNPYEWSAPSDPLELVVTGTSVTPSQLPAGPPSSVTEASRKQNVSPSSKVSPTETSRNITSSPEESGSPIAPARLHYTKGNLARICLGAAILILLAGLLAEDWHRRRRPLLHRVRAVQRPLPPLPQTQRSHGCPERGRPDARHQGLHP